MLDNCDHFLNKENCHKERVFINNQNIKSEAKNTNCPNLLLKLLMM